MRNTDLHGRLHSLERNLGSSTLSLKLGRRTVDLVGLDEPLIAELERRWGGFVVATDGSPSDQVLRFYRAGQGTWLAHWEAGEVYRVESVGDDRQKLVASYHYGIARDDEPRSWRVGISDEPDEPVGRIVENVVRFVAAHMALDDGGFALHSAGVLRDGRAFQLAGPSRTGKSTASRMIAGAESLGDDFGIVVRDETGWLSPALPFDNAERVRNRATSGLYPLAGIWRLHQASETYTTGAADLEAGAVLMSCAAFAWALPERASELLDHVRQFASQGRFGHLYFALGSDLWPFLDAGSGGGEGVDGPGSD